MNTSTDANSTEEMKEGTECSNCIHQGLCIYENKMEDFKVEQTKFYDKMNLKDNPFIINVTCKRKLLKQQTILHRGPNVEPVIEQDYFNTEDFTNGIQIPDFLKKDVIQNNLEKFADAVREKTASEEPKIKERILR